MAEITLVANAGVLVAHGGRALLVDGVHREDGHPFSRVPEADLVRMRFGVHPFERLDYLLFTHEHPDHFTPRLVSELVARRRVRSIFLPGADRGSQDLADLKALAGERGIPFHALSLAPGESARFEPEAGIAVTAIGARHMGRQFQDVRNDCYLLALGGLNLLFTGDADHVPEYYEAALKGVDLDAAFVNPIFFHNETGQAIIRDIFRPREVVIYHMPFADDDTLHFACMVGRDREKYAGSGLPVRVLAGEGQRLRLPGPTA
ncbi:MBL fold metallo-hydrolase [Pseudodesulfovibrio sp.]|uniref:MBL fold metallo-hydrolase n=1 Tax=Pseudodesulfovibrio sp. TaxID=2035812 RepID=UPI002606CE37|nr:MBL fold metallo-hydrolase [Pseudodesulfovibrio sp.]MDD3313078.1 MBL fold metallo-hydrolase [Pseudodesulfovibrio sp.]